MIAQASSEVPLQRIGRPEENAMILAASDHAAFTTGGTIFMSGGAGVSNREDWGVLPAQTMPIARRRWSSASRPSSRSTSSV
jgi:hypothetical protein